MINAFIKPRKAGALPALLVAMALAGPALAQSAPAAASQPVEAVINVGKSQVIELPVPYADVMIADPKIADVLPIGSKSVYVVGKSIGSTALTLYGPGKSLIAAVNVVVSADTEGLKAGLNALLPNERDISVRPANQSIVVSGTVGSPAALQRVLALSESYAPGKVVNMLGVEGTQQVMLSVRFVEMQRNVAKELKLGVQRDPSTGANPNFQVLTGDAFTGAGNLLQGIFGSALLKLKGDGDLNLVFDALETKGLVKTLAEPTLVAMSGDTANFLAGGEFPIPVAQSSAGNGAAPTITIEYKQFGVALAFTPTILSGGMINLVVNPEVSSIDPNTSVNVGLIKVPGIKVRRAHTTVELRDGESFTVAGLLKDEYTSQIRQFPFVGDIPVLGALFRSNGYQKDETELVIVVTPHLVTARRATVATAADNFTPPSDLELFLMGNPQGSGLPAAPAKGGVEGPYGHVLQ
jgi:pilus assembly protein CpaC